MIAVINGSPKKTGSASQVLIDRMLSYEPVINDEFIQVQLHACSVTEDQLSVLSAAGTWIFIFPLYVDSVPGHFLECLHQLSALKVPQGKKVYAVTPMGFFEGEQTRWALRVISNFCNKTGAQYCGGLGVGGTGAFDMMKNIPVFKGPMIEIDTSLLALRENAVKCADNGDVFTTIKFPRIAYFFAGQGMWRKTIKANGLKTKDLNRRITLK